MPRVWSARIRSARSSGSLVARSRPSVMSGRNWSVSKIESTALLDHGHAVEAQARVDVLGRQRRERADRILVVLHEDEVPVLQEALVVAAGEVVGRAPLQAAVEVELAARPARARRPRLPEVLLAGQQDDPRARDADRLPHRDGLLVGAEAERVVALVDRDPDVVGVEAEPVEREVPGVLRRALLEVLADREVAQHLEEGQVPGGRADVLDVDGAKALLAGGDAAGAAASRCPGSRA